MRVIEITHSGGPQVLKMAERNIPSPLMHEVLIKVEAAGVNRPDCLQRAGLYPPPSGASDLPGLEVCGEIIETGSNVSSDLLGQKVMALTNGGGYAQYVSVHEGVCMPIPKGLGAHEAAAIPETLLTVWHNVFGLGQLAPEQNFLVHGGASGIGTMAIQLAKQFGANVFATAGSSQKCALCEELGAQIAINYSKQDFVEEIKQATGQIGAHVILDMVGGDYTARNHKVAARGGRIVQIAALNGAKAQINVALIMLKELVHTGSTLRSQSDQFKAKLTHDVREKVLPLFETGKVRPIIHSRFSLEDAAKAHELMESGDLFGKIVLDV